MEEEAGLLLIKLLSLIFLLDIDDCLFNLRHLQVAQFFFAKQEHAESQLFKEPADGVHPVHLQFGEQPDFSEVGWLVSL